MSGTYSRIMAKRRADIDSDSLSSSELLDYANECITLDEARAIIRSLVRILTPLEQQEGSHEAG